MTLLTPSCHQQHELFSLRDRGLVLYFGFLVELEKHAIASIGLTIIDWPPHPSHPEDDQRGYVLNLFVEPPFRGRGIARRLMEMSEETFINHGILHLVLHATTKGSEFYKAIGWSGTTEMSKTLDPATS
ncbi:MAG: GNAT family N-acetyltransferase [Geminicoccaceae bacterium]